MPATTRWPGWGARSPGARRRRPKRPPPADRERRPPAPPRGSARPVSAHLLRRTRLSAMPRYLTPEWVESFDAALGALDLSDAVAAAGAGSLAAADGTFSVVQVVTGVPDDVAAGGDVHLVLTVDGGRARLGLDPARAEAGTATIVLG